MVLTSDTDKLRVIQNFEVDIVAEIYQSAVKQLAKKYYTESQIEAWSNIPHQKDKFHELIFQPTTYVLEKELKIIAFCGLEKNGHIASLYVHPNFSRQGYGSTILNFVLKQGINLGLKTFHTEASILSQPVFQRHGFKILEIETIKLRGVSFDRYKMGKKH